jgi:MFS family permease
MSNGSDKPSQLLFWGCFIALITTAFGFVGRMFLIPTWAAEFGLDPAQAGRLAGIGIWPFAVSIILFSLVIDKIGYRIAMVFAFLGHVIWACMGVGAYFVKADDPELAFSLLYWGSLILALGNGTVEAFINPVVATMFSKEKTKWLNILHAGWPGGLVITGLLLIFMGDIDWYIKIGIIAVPAVVYFLMLIGARFPVQERVASGVSYREMLQEFGILGAALVGFLLALQLMDFFKGVEINGGPIPNAVFIGISAALVIAFGIYTRALGRPLMFFLIVIMMPLATTEIGTDGWITAIMEKVIPVDEATGLQAFHAGWVLIYTSMIMLVLRFFAGPIVHRFSPLGLLAGSAILAIIGLYTLSFTTGLALFGAATLYGVGKTFFWPTMLGVVSEQSPKGGALTLNAISGIGMLAVGTLGFPFIGKLQVDTENAAVVANAKVVEAVPGLVNEAGELQVVEERNIYEVITYKAISNEKLEEAVKLVPAAMKEEVTAELAQTRQRSGQAALAKMAYFPLFMLACYLLLILYFKGRGGYKPVELQGDGGDGP